MASHTWIKHALGTVSIVLLVGAAGTLLHEVPRPEPLQAEPTPEPWVTQVGRPSATPYPCAIAPYAPVTELNIAGTTGSGHGPWYVTRKGHPVSGPIADRRDAELLLLTFDNPQTFTLLPARLYPIYCAAAAGLAGRFR